MQSLGRLLFHGGTECIALNVMRKERTKEHRHASRECDHQEYCNRGDEDEYFPSQGYNEKRLGCYNRYTEDRL